MATRTSTTGIQVNAKDLGLINHIAFLIDMSGSMSGKTSEVIKMFDQQMANLARLTTENGQETRISVYLFDTVVECVCFDKDVLRIPSIKQFYQPRGMTALIDATFRSIEDLEKSNTLYGDHAFLLIGLTDGEENSSRRMGGDLKKRIDALGENWTVALLVPNARDAAVAQRFGFSAGNIDVWDMSKNVEISAGSKMTSVTTNFMTGRAKGVRGTKSVFVELEVKNLNESNINKKLTEVDPSKFLVFDVRPTEHRMELRPFIAARGQQFTIGSSFYKLTKKETVQRNKEIAIRNKKTSQVFSGPNARQLLGLPDQEVKVDAASTPDYDIFIQSNSVNRKLEQGTELLFFK